MRKADGLRGKLLLSSSARELLLIGSKIMGNHVLVQMGNASVVAYINWQGGTRSSTFSRVLYAIIQWAETNLASLSAVHIQGYLNGTTDYLSCSPLKPREWSLHPEVFAFLTARWGLPQIDLFTTHCNAQVPVFSSLCPHGNPAAVAVLAQEWNFRLAYGFPLFAILVQVIRKVAVSRGWYIVVTLLWPKRGWFSL